MSDVRPQRIMPQGEGSTLDADRLDGKHYRDIVATMDEKIGAIQLLPGPAGKDGQNGRDGKDGVTRVVHETVREVSASTSARWFDIIGKPATFPPSVHNHDDRYSQIPVTVPVSSVTVSVGTLTSGGVLEMSTLYDDGMKVQEASSTPGFVIDLGFSSLPDVKYLRLHLWYDGLMATHLVHIKRYNVLTSTFDFMTSFTQSVGYQMFYLPFTNPSNYINSGDVLVRINHVSAGHFTHNITVDYAALIY